MGAEHSRRNSFHAYEDSQVPCLMNNQDSLKFHSVHGDNVRLFKSSSVASRDEGFCKGIVFSHRPVVVNEYVYVKFVELSTNWSGGLRIGFTANDPTVYKQKLPKYACPCMTDMVGNWARALAERFVQKDSILFYYVNQRGEVHYGLNDEERGFFFSGVNTTGKLWAMMDIYGNTIRIELITNHRHLGNNMRKPSISASTSALACSGSSSTPSSVWEENQLINWMPISFHSIHGRHVTLDEKRNIAMKNAEMDGHGYAFSECPFRKNNYIAIQILATTGTNDDVVVGLTSCNPNALSMEELPNCPDELLDRPEYWVVNTVKEHCQQDDIFLFSLNSDGAVKYSKNGSMFTTIFFVDHTLDLWIFMDLSKSISKIKLEGLLNEHQNWDVATLYQSLRSSIDSQKDASSSQSTGDGFSECVICYEAGINCALYRCGHVCMCYQCGKQLQRSVNPHCPICREEIKDVIKIYK